MACPCCKWFSNKNYKDMEGDGRAVSFPPPHSAVAASIVGKQSQEVSEEEKKRRRELAAEQAQKRQAENLARGVGDVQKAKDMQERGQKETILGKIEEHYAKQKEDMPMGLRMASLEQLQQHLKHLQEKRCRADSSCSTSTKRKWRSASGSSQSRERCKRISRERSRSCGESRSRAKSRRQSDKNGGASRRKSESPAAAASSDDKGGKELDSTEAAIKILRAQRDEAVEAEDYQLAKSLKFQEQELQRKLEALKEAAAKAAEEAMRKARSRSSSSATAKGDKKCKRGSV